jgi:hypothetical protein
MRTKSLAGWWVVCAVAWPLAACDSVNPASPTRETAGAADVQGRASAASADNEAAGGVEKVDICHRPPGNPTNVQRITVGAPAVPAHLAHGDTIGTIGDCSIGGGG